MVLSEPSPGRRRNAKRKDEATFFTIECRCLADGPLLQV